MYVLFILLDSKLYEDMNHVWFSVSFHSLHLLVIKTSRQAYDVGLSLRCLLVSGWI